MTRMVIGEKPPCHNRPMPDTTMSPEVCHTWDGRDNRIFDPAHPDYGQNKGDYYPIAMGFAPWCNTCQHKPAHAP